MPAPTTSWNLVRVYGTWRGQDGGLRAGTYKVTIPVRITNATDDVIIPAGVYAEGALQTSVNGSPSLDVQVPATDDPDNLETGWKVRIEVRFTDGAAAETYQIDVPYASAGVNLRTIVLSPNPTVQAAQLKVGLAGGLARLDSDGDVVDADGIKVTAGGIINWADLSGKPATFPPAPHTHVVADIFDATPLGRSLMQATDAASARSLIGAGTGSGTGSVTSNDITDASTVGKGVLTAASASAARTILGAGTSSLALGTTAGTAKSGDYVPAWGEVTGKPSTFPPTIGTTSTTAKAGDYVPAWTEVTNKPSTFPPATHTHPAADVTGLAAVATTGAMSDVAGTLNLSQLASGGTFTVKWNGTAWRYNGATITSRPTSRADVTMIAIGNTTAPNFGLADDLWLKDLA